MQVQSYTLPARELEILLAGHGVGVMLLRGQYELAGHAVHVSSPNQSLNEPGLQEMQDSLGDLADVTVNPGLHRHCAGSTFPVFVVLALGMHCVHVVLASNVLNVPRLQGTHASVELKRPASHIQSVARVALVFVKVLMFAGQWRHVIDSWSR